MSQDRPSIEQHEHLGAILSRCHRTLDILGRRRANACIGIVRSNLDDWLQVEWPMGELSQERFFRVYYHDHGCLKGESEVCIALDKACQILCEMYPQGTRLKTALKRLRGVQPALKRYRSKPDKARVKFLESWHENNGAR